MDEHISCDKCSGCAGRHTDERAMEEAKAGPYILFAAVLIVAVSLLIKWVL